MMRLASDAGAAAAVVCVPARNEAARIGRLLASLAAQSVAEAANPLRVVVLVNNSTDTTGDVVRGFHQDPRLVIRLIETTLPPEQAHAGTARRLAMNAGADWVQAEGMLDGVLVSTDADAIAPPGWVAANLAALAHAELVGGRLVIASDGDASAPLTALHACIDRYWAAVRAIEDKIDPPAHDPAPRHGDHTGASLALHAALYTAVGGVPPIASGEDNALVSSVVRNGGRVRHCPDVWIEVSAREMGRAKGGMAREMVRRRETLAEGTPYLLPSAAFWRAQFERRAAWRAQWPSMGGGYGNAIAYIAHRESTAPPDREEHVPIEDALAALDRMVGTRDLLPA